MNNSGNVSYATEIHQKDENLPNLLMLHGFMGDHRVFDHLINDLCAFCNPITVDLPGHGRSSAPVKPEEYQAKKQVDDIAVLIRKLGLTPLFLHGYSMGGRLALKTALAHPNLFRGLILESTNCGITDRQARKKRQQTDRQRAEQIIDDFDHFLSHWQQLPLFEPPNPADTQLQEKYMAVQQSQAPKAIAASLRGFGTGSMQACCQELGRLHLPTLLLAGSADKKYQQINSCLVEKLPDAHFTSIEAGHRVHVDNPEEFIVAIQVFMYGRN